MRRISVRRVTVQSFRAFQAHQSSPELPLVGLVGLRGFNRDTGGSSGAGKSSVAYAIAYAFDFLPFSASSQQNWHSDVPMQVELELDTPEGPAVLRRGKETSLTWNGETVRGSVKIVAEAVKKMWGGVDPDLIRVLTFRQQKGRQRFLTMKDAERKEFLTMLLGLGEIEAQISEAVKNSNTLEAQAQELSAVITALWGQLVEPAKPELEDLGFIENQIEELGRRIAEFTVKKQNAEAELQNKVLTLEKERPRLSDYVRVGLAENGQPLRDWLEQLEECKQRLARAKALETSHRNRIKEQADKLQPVLDGLRDIVGRHPMLIDGLARLEVDIEALKKSQCQTCGRQWEDAAVELESSLRKKAGLEELLRGSVIAREKLKARRAEYDQLVADAEAYTLPTVGQLQSIVDDLNQKITQENARLTAADRMAHVEAQRDLAIALEAHEKRCRLELEDIKTVIQNSVQTLDSARREIEALKSKQGLIRQAQKIYETSFQAYEALRTRIAVKEEEYAQLKKKANEEADYAAMIKGFLVAYFEEVLNEISSEANEILKNIPNTPTTTVNFVTEVQTAKGITRQEIKPIVTKNGVVIDPESGVSGGQMESVELAVDLSVVKVIGGRTGVQPGFMIFDESFSAHCLPVKQACMAVLAQAAKDCMILVVDHATELQDSFTAFVDVESQNDVSRFILN